MSYLGPLYGSRNATVWHVGISPDFPSHVVVSDDLAIESIFADVPLLSVGLLGFGTLTFFFVMRKFDRVAIYLFSSVIIAFIAGVLNVSQVLIRGRLATDMDIRVSTVLPLLITREVSLALSIGIRFLFFWSFVARPPRGERPASHAPSQEQWVNFLRMEPDLHSGCWMRLGAFGILLKYSLLFSVLAIPVLQILWRVVGEFSRFGPLYNAEAMLEIILSALFILKLLSNTWLSPLRPRWKTVRGYSPVITALLFGVGIGIGNMLIFQFSETSFGRFLQAVELYILVLYILISAFYKRPDRLSMFEPMENQNTLIPGDDVTTENQASAGPVTPTAALLPNKAAGTPSRPRRPRLSSWLVSDADDNLTSGASSQPSSSKLSSWLTRRKSDKRAQPRPWVRMDQEGGALSVDAEPGYGTGPRNSAAGSQGVVPPNETVYMSSTQPLKLVSQRPERVNTPLSRSVMTTNATYSSARTTEDYSEVVPPVDVPKATASPVYGLGGIVGYYESSPLNRRSDASDRSISLEELQRQQAELDKSVAELRSLASMSTYGITPGGQLAVPGGLPAVSPGAVSLSEFPEPPEGARAGRPVQSGVNQTRWQDGTGVTGPSVAPRVLRRTPQSRRQLSFPSTTRSSSDSDYLGPSSRTVVGGGGVQYDVTSFIGDLSKPASQENLSTRPMIKQPDLEDVSVPITSSVEAPSAPVAQTLVPSDARGMEVEETPAAMSPPLRRVKQNLPVRTRPYISSPIRVPSPDKWTAYESPRPVPSTSR